MPVILLIAAAAILGGVVAAALGRAGELGRATADSPPVDLGVLSPADVALLRPAMSLWGYNMQVTEDALQAIARALTSRDVEIASLRSQLAERDGLAVWPAPTRDERAAPAAPQAPSAARTQFRTQARAEAAAPSAPDSPGPAATEPASPESASPESAGTAQSAGESRRDG